MKTECYPGSLLPHPSRLYLDYVDGAATTASFYAGAPFPGLRAVSGIGPQVAHRASLADMLAEQNAIWGATESSAENVERLRGGASAIVTGQQVGLFGGPLLTLMKAATAIRLAADASAKGHPHVPIFWMATEDHDFAEVNHVTLPERHRLRRFTAAPSHTEGTAVGRIVLDAQMREVLDQAGEILGGTSFYDLLLSWYAPGRTMAEAFGSMMAQIFAKWKLLVIDASSRAAHLLGSDVLRQAILQVDSLREALRKRDQELASFGYHSQVLVTEQSSLLFLIDAETQVRHPLRRVNGEWKAGARRYDQQELLDILEDTPERISPNALLRPVFQDVILPTAGYVGGPAEVAYFAQSQVLYEQILGRTTPIIPRLSATLIEPSTATVMTRHGVSVDQVVADGAELAQRLGARSMPVEGKQRLAAAGKALDEELTQLTTWMAAMDGSLGKASMVSASKMRYQMNRLRRLAANYQLQRDESLRRHADALLLALYPERHPQERIIGGAYYLARYGEEVVAALIDAADTSCPGHKAIWLD